MSRKTKRISSALKKTGAAKETGLIAAEALYRQLFENMSNCVAIYEARDKGKDFIITDFNRSAERAEQVKRKDIVGKSVLKVFPGVKKFGIFKSFQRVWRTGKPERLPVSVYKDDRISGWRENYIYKLPSGEIVAVYEDLTKQKQAEEEIRLRDLRLRSLTDNLIGGMIYQVVALKDGKRKFLYVSDSVKKLYGITPQQAMADGNLIYSRVFIEDRQRLIDEELRALKKFTPLKTEVRIVNPDGTIRWSSFVSNPTKMPDGNVHWNGFEVDITERRRMEEDLKRSEEPYKIISEKTDKLIYDYDVRSGQINWFGNIKKITGFTKKEFAKMNIKEWERMIHPADRTYALRELAKAMKEKTNYDILYRFQRENKEYFWVHDEGLFLYSHDVAYRMLGVMDDVTETKNREEVLRLSEERFAISFHSAPYVMILSRLKDGKIFEINDQFIKSTGYKSSEVIGKSTIDLKLWASEKDRKFVVSNILKGKKVRNLEFVFRIKSGKKIWGSFFAEIITINNEKCLLSSIQDITENKKLTDDLKASELRFRNSFEQSPHGAALISLDKKFIRVNSALCKFLGYSSKEIVGKKLDEFSHPDDLKLCERAMKDLFVGNPAVARLQKRCIKKNGDIVWGNFSISLIRDAEKKPLYFFPIIEDVTTKKILEEKFLEIKERDEAILASLGEAVFACDAEGKIVIFNEIASKLTGVPVREALGKKYSDVVIIVREHEDKPNYDFIDDYLRTYQISGNKNHREIIRRDGRKIPIFYTAAPVKINGKLFGVVVVFRDISEEREIERIKSEFVSLSSHQLRTPLTSINWISEMFLNGDFGTMTDKQRENIAAVSTSGRRMAELISALLNVSRLELGAVAISPKRVVINRAVDEVLVEFQVPLKTKKLKIIKKFTGKNLSITTDPTFLRILLQNLISNAINYSFPEKEIVISVSVDKKNFLISVKDEGIGIPAEEQKRLFTKLFRASNAALFETKGTGLGLYIVKSILELLGGKIWFTSTLNKGSEFFISLPKKAQKSKEGSKTLEIQSIKK